MLVSYNSILFRHRAVTLYKRDLESITNITVTAMSSSRIVRASVVQTCTQAYSLTDTLDKMEQLTRLASERLRSFFLHFHTVLANP